MDTITLASGAALGVAGILSVYWVSARWPAWKAKAKSWFTRQKSALEARAEGERSVEAKR